MSECARDSCRLPATVPFLPHCSPDCRLVDDALSGLPEVTMSSGRMTVGEDVAVRHAPAWLDARRRDAS